MEEVSDNIACSIDGLIINMLITTTTITLCLWEGLVEQMVYGEEAVHWARPENSASNYNGAFIL